MAATKTDRHLKVVPNKPTPAEHVESLRAVTALLAERRAIFARQHGNAREAALAPDVIADRNALISKLLYRLSRRGADKQALLREFAIANYVHGHMDAAAEERAGLTDGTLAIVSLLEEQELSEIRKAEADAKAKAKEAASCS